MTDQPDWKLDAPGARAHSLTHPRGSHPPHWLRCEYMHETGERCIHGEKHQGDHQLPKEKKT